MQVDQFIDNGFNGERGANSDVAFAHVEFGGIDNEIFAYKEDSSGGTRIRQLYDCLSSGCTPVSDYADPDGHATRTASLVFADLEDGQDPSITTTVARRDRSGFGTEAQGYFLRGDLFAAVDEVAGISSNQPIAVNMSFFSGSAGTCPGTDAFSRTVNELFESGTLTFKSAGNENHSSSTDCTATPPGAAIGSFTVAAYGDTASSTLADVRSDGLCEDSSRGGTSTEGGGRSIIDVAAYAPREKMARAGNLYSGGGCLTSYAAPTALGAALDFADHYSMTYSSLIDNPGILHVAMLMMGDRKQETGSALETGFSNLYGAGRLRMRRWDEEGLDGPWGFQIGSVCVDHGQALIIPLNGGNPLSADVNPIKAAIYWYDWHHGLGSALDDRPSSPADFAKTLQVEIP
jgi:hypothetical protein